MKHINRIKIQYFRSIYKIDIKEISSSLTVFTGKNDTGKSNILRALNLFFNNEVDPNDKLDFERDFSKIRNQQIKESSKERKLISIEIEFINPGTYSTLEKTFTYRKSWDRYGKLVESDWKKGVSEKGKGSANKFLNSIEYIYIPAIKDKNTFSDLLQRLKSSLPKPKTLEVEKFNNEIKTYGQDLKDDLLKNIQLEPTLALPTSINELFSSLDFNISDGIIQTSLSQRGDGIRCRFIPAIINYIAQNNKTKRYIWGLEEPENSLEYEKVLELNDTLEVKYSKNAQIFVTSHSPAFVGSIGEKSSKCIHMLARNDKKIIEDTLITRKMLTDPEYSLVENELGYIQLQKDLADKLSQHKKILDKKEEELNKLKEEMENKQNKYILFVEGIYDEIILKEAWNKLNPNQSLPFHIHVCGGKDQIKIMLSRNEIIKVNTDKIFVGMFDFDSAYDEWCGLHDCDSMQKNNKKTKLWINKVFDEKIGLLKKHVMFEKYAFLLPIPDFRQEYASKKWGASSKLEIELLFQNDIITKHGDAKDILTVGGGKIFNITEDTKKKISSNVHKFEKEDFEEFRKIFDLIRDIQSGVYK